MLVHQGMEYASVPGSVPPLRGGAKLLGDDPWYLISPTSFAVGSLKGKAVKWRNLGFSSEPPARVNFMCWLGRIEEREFVFVFGGQVVDEVPPSIFKDEGGGKASGSKKKKEDEGPKLRFKASTKMYCCDIEQKTWRSVAMENSTPSPRGYALACAAPEGGLAFMGFGRSLPELLKLSDIWMFDFRGASIGFPEVCGCKWRRIQTAAIGVDALLQNPLPAPRLQPSAISLFADKLLLFGGQVGDVGCADEKLADDMWTLDVQKERWTPVKYAGYYPGARRDAFFVRASGSELILIGGHCDTLDPNLPPTAEIASPTHGGGGGGETGLSLAQSQRTVFGGAPSMDTLVFDVELAIFTRPAIGFLPRQVSPNLFVGSKLPCLHMTKKTGMALIQYPAPKKPPPKREEPTEELTRNDAERMLFRTRKEMDELENTLQAVCKQRLDLRAQIEELQPTPEAQEETETAYAQIDQFRQNIRRQEDVEAEVLSWISEETRWRRNFGLLNRRLKNLVAAAEAKLFSEQVLEYAESGDGGEAVADHRIGELENDAEKCYGTHAQELAEVRNLLRQPEFQELLQTKGRGGARKVKIDKLIAASSGGSVGGGSAAGSVAEGAAGGSVGESPASSRRGSVGATAGKR